MMPCPTRAAAPTRADVTQDPLREPSRVEERGRGWWSRCTRFCTASRSFLGTGYPKATSPRKRKVSYLREGVGLPEFLRVPYRGPSDGLPRNPDRIPGATFANRAPPKIESFVAIKLQSRFDRR